LPKRLPAVVSPGSCTTNCLANLAVPLHRRFGIEQGGVTSIHSYMADQSLLDVKNRDLRRSRAGAVNMVPLPTRSAINLGRIIPELAGKISGQGVRVPVCLMEAHFCLEEMPTEKGVVSLFVKQAADYPDIVALDSEQRVSSDFVRDIHSAVIAMDLIRVEGKMVHLYAWHDNEWGFARRMLDLVALID